MQVKDLQTPLANHFKLTPEEVNAIYDSGNGKVFRDRISWALSYLFMAKLIEKPRRGEYVISQMGKEMIASCNEEQINAFINKAVNKPKATTENVTTPTDATNPVEATELTPQEALNNSFKDIKQSIKTDLLATILSKKPQAFEILVVDLLQAMGYGGEIKNAGVVTQLSNDGGIDGIIKEDVFRL
jgi:mrr restriction system protein